ncbi:flagellar hook protein FlgE [Clostridium beijerinckii]|nr:flagellar hook protein FlgE [Clostridium beijerinckii]NYC64759.1 flagellar hook protein FlgE [Clostridium beijerinckii]NYC87155.1 flagellar hook protein FlgE [Clostridium beijerinckii]OOM43470.1 flagellar hook protein FlgE [Clostridium beijerinckii]
MLRCMYSGISGMKVNQTKLDVIGNNIANVGTTAFKSSSARFKDMLYQNASEATAPTSVLGGTNAKQIGLGAQVSSINKVMGQGNALSTGRSLDVCIDGDGYLVVAKGDLNSGIGANQSTGAPDTAATDATGEISETLFTRDGNLTLDYQGNLLTADGHRVMGYYLTASKNDGGTDNAKSLTYDSTNNVINANYVNADSKQLTVSDSTMRPLVIPDSVTISGTPGAADAVTQPVKKFEIGKDGYYYGCIRRW